MLIKWQLISEDCALSLPSLPKKIISSPSPSRHEILSMKYGDWISEIKIFLKNHVNNTFAPFSIIIFDRIPFKPTKRANSFLFFFRFKTLRKRFFLVNCVPYMTTWINSYLCAGLVVPYAVSHKKYNVSLIRLYISFVLRFWVSLYFFLPKTVRYET